MLSGRARAADAIHKNMIPANLGLAEAELVLSGKMGRELTLKRALHESRRQYEMILIDCPPALGLLTVNALVASTHALVSAEGEYFSLQGVEQVLEVMQLARENLNENLEWLGVVMNIADLRTNHSRDALESLRESFGDRCSQPSSAGRSATRSPPSAASRSSTTGPSSARDYLVARRRAAHAAWRRGNARTAERVPRRAGAGRPGGDRPGEPASTTTSPGKVVLITGAARGIGAEAARQLYAKGAQLSLVGIEPEMLEQRAAELGPRAAWFEADVTDMRRARPGGRRNGRALRRHRRRDRERRHRADRNRRDDRPGRVRAHDRDQPAGRVAHRSGGAAARRSGVAATSFRSRRSQPRFTCR